MAEVIYPLRQERRPDPVERFANLHVGSPRPFEAVRDTPLSAALWYAAFGEWPQGSLVAKLSKERRSETFAQALQRFHQLAADGVLHVWGKPVSARHTDVFVPIDKEHWTHAAVDMPMALRVHASSTSRQDAALTYSDLQVSQSEFDRAFPRA